MPSSSPKFFHARKSAVSSTSLKWTLVIISSLAIGVAGFLFGITAILHRDEGGVLRCAGGRPRSVRVVWDQHGNDDDFAVMGLNSDGGEYSKKNRHKVMGFVGIQTGFGSVGRRRSLRKTWMPSDHIGLKRLEEATGLAFRFVIGKTNDKSKMSELENEIAAYDDFMLLDIEEEYSKLPYKTLAFFKAAYSLFDAEFYVKADDDIYLRPDRLSLLLAKERSHSQTYLGCMKKGPVFTDSKLKWQSFY
ncbi:hypothetical protein ACFE04_005129 [Oxalis oulophora]